VGIGVAGIDEAGRGALAGPVVAAAVVLGPKPWPVFHDSKTISSHRRVALFDWIMAHATVGIGVIGHDMIDQVNILQATMMAMVQAVDHLPQSPEWMWVDGNRIPRPLQGRATPIVDGDVWVSCISAASIVAKVTRDRMMTEWGHQYIQYGFDRHFGYGTRQHYEVLNEWGPSPIHRHSFRLAKRVA